MRRAEYFNLSGVTATAVFTPQGCLDFLREHTADLILLDINLGESSGFDLCRTLRGTTQIPILFVSARHSDDNVLLGRVKAVLRRCGFA